ncbi:MAG: hypothetical protein AAGA23_03370 [Pseudomonadota bacterium]
MLKLIERKRSKAVRDWMRKEAKEQKARYKKIVQEMDDLSPKRDKWIDEFLYRIQTRGFNVHKDEKRLIRPEELPKKPRRKFKVIF